MLLLTREELAELTGYKRPGDQARWLAQQGIQHYMGADGRPKVIRESLLKSPTMTRPPVLRLAR